MLSRWIETRVCWIEKGECAACVPAIEFHGRIIVERFARRGVEDGISCHFWDNRSSLD